MKRYVVSVGRAVNTQASKTGIKYVFDTRTDDPEEWIRKNGKYYQREGFRIKDSLTNEIYHLEEGERNVKTTD